MLSDKDVQRQYRITALLSIRGWLAFILIAVVGIFVTLFTPKANPMDDKVTKNREIVDQVFVVDKNNNGFRVAYATIDNVTKERLDEIQARRSTKDSLARLKATAPAVFGDMLLTDIYDFAHYAIQFDPPDTKIHNIFVFGADKENLYVGENPRIENWAKFINSGTAQGLLYLTSEDIYFNSSDRRKAYRYFRCSGLNQISEYDEHFSHFSESERIY